MRLIFFVSDRTMSYNVLPVCLALYCYTDSVECITTYGLSVQFVSVMRTIYCILHFAVEINCACNTWHCIGGLDTSKL